MFSNTFDSYFFVYLCLSKYIMSFITKMTSNMKYLDVEMHINDLAEFIFIKNVNNAVIELSLGGVENNKDLFFFLLDLFCKGLVLLFGNESQSVDIELLTEKDFIDIKNKMNCAGIDVVLTTYPCDIEMPINDVKSIINISEIEAEDDNKQLQNYEFKLCSSTMMYIINFELIHRTI